jgi:hypothetical protein
MMYAIDVMMYNLIKRIVYEIVITSGLNMHTSMLEEGVNAYNEHEQA